jgi:hypothetical protein
MKQQYLPTDFLSNDQRRHIGYRNAPHHLLKEIVCFILRANGHDSVARSHRQSVFSDENHPGRIGITVIARRLSLP